MSMKPKLKIHALTLTKLVTALLFTAVAGLLVACAQSAAPQPTPTSAPVEALPTANLVPTQPEPTPTETALPQIPDELTVPETAADVVAQPYDSLLERVDIVVTFAEITKLDAENSEAVLQIAGTYPTPCHRLRIDVDTSTSSEVRVDAYSLIEPGRGCRGMEQAFDLDIPLGDLQRDKISLIVNDEEMKTMNLTNIDLSEIPAGMKRFEIANYNASLNKSSQSILVQGVLPNPCHQFTAKVSPPNANNEVHVDVYSLVDPNMMCTQVLVDFSETVELPALRSGAYSVWVNGENLGTLDTQE